MQTELKPLFSLTIGEFMALVRRLVGEALADKTLAGTQQAPGTGDEEVFTIRDLMDFLKCSKASIHNYKNAGLPFYRVGRKVLFRKAEVLSFMKGLKNRKQKLS